MTKGVPHQEVASPRCFDALQLVSIVYQHLPGFTTTTGTSLGRAGTFLSRASGHAVGPVKHTPTRRPLASPPLRLQSKNGRLRQGGLPGPQLQVHLQPRRQRGRGRGNQPLGTALGRPP